jgi:hypothetical protein
MGIEFEFFFQCFDLYFHFDLEPYSNMLIFFQIPGIVLKFLKVVKRQKRILNDLSFQWSYHSEILNLLNKPSRKSIFMDKFYQDIFFHFNIYVHFMNIDFKKIQNLQYLIFFFESLEF